MEMSRLVPGMLMIVSVAALIFFGLYTISQLTGNVDVAIANQKEIRIETIAEELGIDKKEVIEDKPFFKNYYEYTTSAGIFRAVFSEKASLTSIVKVE